LLLPCRLILASGTPVNYFCAKTIEPGGFLSMGECLVSGTLISAPLNERVLES
jgi:hypothetical protein